MGNWSFTTSDLDQLINFDKVRSVDIAKGLECESDIYVEFDNGTTKIIKSGTRDECLKCMINLKAILDGVTNKPEIVKLRELAEKLVKLAEAVAFHYIESTDSSGKMDL